MPEMRQAIELSYEQNGELFVLVRGHRSLWECTVFNEHIEELSHAENAKDSFGAIQEAVVKLQNTVVH